jgi:hypothetical protein
MKRTHASLKTVLATALLIGGGVYMNQVRAADNPLDPTYMSADDKAYWSKMVAKMADEKGMVTKEAFMKYYEGIWDEAVPSGKTATIDEVTNKWAARDHKDAQDPQYQTRMARREHVKLMDTDNDGTVSREEFVKHMQEHWASAVASAKAQALTAEQAMHAMVENPLDPNFKHR